jgi:hypothetical protein
MPFIGNKPSAVPLTSADIADSIITSAKIVDGAIVNADINASSAIAISKISATGTANQVLRMNSGATALEFATPSSGISNYFSAYDTSGAGVSGDLILSSTFVNSGSNYSTVTGLYTAPSAGDYYFWFVYSRAGGSSSTFAIEKNNSTLTGAESEVAPTANIYQQGTIQIIATLAINDTIGITTVNNAYPDKCFFGGWKIS